LGIVTLARDQAEGVSIYSPRPALGEQQVQYQERHGHGDRSRR